MKKAIVFGASGNTGKLLVAQLLQQGIQVLAVARIDHWLSESQKADTNLTYQQAFVDQWKTADFIPLLQDCDWVFCCLGHNLSAKGIWGKPRKLVANTIRQCCNAIEQLAPSKPIKLVLMASTGCANYDLREQTPLSQRIVVALLRILIPPHRDNELAVKWLRQQVGQQHPFIQWVIARPDQLVDHSSVSAYQLEPSPIRNAIFDAGQTSRINVAHFMGQVAMDEDMWQQWMGKMPVLYNQS